MENNKAHRHKKMSKPLAALIFIITLPFVIAGLVFFGLIYIITTVIPAPVEMIIYKNSQFYKDLKIKYSLGITKNFGYKSYKYVRKNPNLQFICQSEGYYYYKKNNSILVMPYYAEYNYKNGEWFLTMKEGGEEINAKEIKPTFQMLIKEKLEEYDIKLLVKEKLFKKEDLNAAKSDPVFVFYKNHKDFDVI